MTIKREKLVNDASTTLNGAINDSTTTVTVTDGSVFPSTGNFRVIINNEIMKVTGRSTNDLTVERGAESTTAASHSDTDTITAIVTAGAIDALLVESTIFGSSTPEFIFSSGDIRIDSTDFNWVNQGSATVTDNAHSITLAAPTNSSAIGYRGMFRNTPITPYTVTAYCLFGIGYKRGASGTSIGIGFRESGTGKLMMIDFRLESNVRVAKMTDPSTLSSAAATSDNENDRLWLKLSDNGTDLTLSYSIDDDTYSDLFTESRTTFMAGGPDQIGFAINPYDVSGSVGNAHFLSWIEE